VALLFQSQIASNFARHVFAPFGGAGVEDAASISIVRWRAPRRGELV
jgi:hypothetical protein